MKKVFIMAILAALTVSAVGCARSTEKGNDGASAANCCGSSSAAAGTAGYEVPASPFDGLGLTEEQQTRINEIKATFGPRKRACLKALKEVKNDPEKQQELCRLQRHCMAKMKEILTPEQYVAFLENLVVVQNLRR